MEVEGIWLRVHVNSTSFIIVNIYRPPLDSTFFDRFYDVLEKVGIKYRNVPVVGDLNSDFSCEHR